MPGLPLFPIGLWGGQSTLPNGITAYWKLDEASGVAVDSGPNGFTLTDNNTVTSAAGQVGTARQFTAASFEFLSVVDSAAIRVDGSFTAALWFFLPTLPTTRGALLSNITGLGAALGAFELDAETGGTVSFYANKVTVGSASAASGVLAAATWHHVVIWYDSVAATISMAIDNAAPAVTSIAGGMNTANPKTWYLGSRSGTGNFLNGRVDDAKYAKRVWTAAERAEDYANGLAGRALL